MTWSSSYLNCVIFMSTFKKHVRPSASSQAGAIRHRGVQKKKLRQCTTSDTERSHEIQLLRWLIRLSVRPRDMESPTADCSVISRTFLMTSRKLSLLAPVIPQDRFAPITRFARITIIMFSPSMLVQSRCEIQLEYKNNLVHVRDRPNK